MNAALIGYGKMGKEIEKILLERGHRVTLIVDENNEQELNPQNLKEKGVEVAIEFTTPQTAFQHIEMCLKSGVKVVCGTTGWLDHRAEAEELCRKNDGAFFYASNYSIGVNIFFQVNRRLAELMNAFPEYDVTVEETHHVQKKDAPSGTAITIAEDIVNTLDRKSGWIGQTTTAPEELEVVSVRRSVVPGTHTVTYESDADLIRIEHQAKSRKGFALGAVLAAEFLRERKGVFSMDDLLGM